MKTKKKQILLFVVNHITEIVLLVAVLFLWSASSRFMSFNNWMNILRSGAVKGVVALGVTIVLIAGKIDLSTGSQVALSGMIVAWFCKNMPSHGMDLTVATFVGMVVALIVAVIVGTIHAIIQDKWNIPPFIITLAMQYLLYGVAATICGGYPISNVFPDWFKKMGMGRLGGMVPYPILIFIVLWAITLFIMSHTTTGRSVFAIGGNQESARLSGINIRKTKLFVFISVQVCACLAGFINSAQVMSADYTYAKDWPTDIISMVVIGGTTMTGGSGTVVGTLLGIILISVLLNGMTILNVNIYFQYVVRGFILLASVLIMTYRDRLRD